MMHCGARYSRKRKNLQSRGLGNMSCKWPLKIAEKDILKYFPEFMATRMVRLIDMKGKFLTSLAVLYKILRVSLIFPPAFYVYK